MLHGHAVATGMGFGAYLSFCENWIDQEEMDRILRLINNLELSLWHPIMKDTHKIFMAQEKMIEKRGGNLAAPIPKGLGQCGYLNDMPYELLDQRLAEYYEICQGFSRRGLGIEAHCKDVGLEDPATVGGVNMQLPEESNGCSKADITNGHSEEISYNDWIETVQKKRNKDLLSKSSFTKPQDTPHPPQFEHNELCHPGMMHFLSFLYYNVLCFDVHVGMGASLK